MAPYSAPKPMSWTRWIPPSSVSNQAKTTAAPNSPPKEAAAKSPARTLKAIRSAFEPGAATSGAPAGRSPPSIPDLLSDVRSAHPNPRLVLDPRRLASPSGGSQHLTREQRERTRSSEEGGRVRRGGGWLSGLEVRHEGVVLVDRTDLCGAAGGTRSPRCRR